MFFCLYKNSLSKWLVKRRNFMFHYKLNIWERQDAEISGTWNGFSHHGKLLSLSSVSLYLYLFLCSVCRNNMIAFIHLFLPLPFRSFNFIFLVRAFCCDSLVNVPITRRFPFEFITRTTTTAAKNGFNLHFFFFGQCSYTLSPNTQCHWPFS